MSIYIFDWNALQKMTEMEGDRWMQDQLKEPDPEPNCSFRSFKEVWMREINFDEQLMKKEGCISLDGNPSIYGFEGWHRYFVRNDGRIEFSSHHADHDEVIIQKAKDIGFDID